MVSLASAEVAVDVEAWNAPILRSHLTPRRTKGKTNGSLVTNGVWIVTFGNEAAFVEAWTSFAAWASATARES